MKKAGILLTILLFSMLTAFLTIMPPVMAQASDPQEMNSGMGRPYQDLIGVNASSNGINLTVRVWLAGAPPKADADRHIEIYVTIDTDNATNSGEDYLPLYSDAAIGPTMSPDGPGGGHYYWEYCVDLRRWTNPALRLLNFYPTTGVNNATAAGTIGVTNSSANFADALFSPYTVNMTIPLATIRNPKNVTLGVVTIEREGTIEPSVDYPPPTNFAHVARDTIGNFSVPFTANWGQWLEFKPAIIGLLTSAGSSKSASDPTGDFAALPCNDVTKVEVGQGQGSAIINVTMANMTYIWGTTWMYASRWQLVIAVDTDGIPGSGQAWLPGTPGYGTGWESGLADVRIDPAASDTYWERAIVIDRIGTPTTIYLYDTNFNNLGAMGITVTRVGEKIKIVIPVGALALAMPHKLNLTVASGQDWYNLVNDVVGTWSYKYNSTVNTQGYYSVQTSIPPTEEIMPVWPGYRVPASPSVIGRPYQDIRGVWAKADGTDLKVSVTLDQGPPKGDNENHVNMYVAIDNGTVGGSWQFPDAIDVGYVTNTTFWEYCLALYNWTTPGAQSFKLFRINKYVTAPLTPSWSEVSTTGISVTNSTDGKTVNMTIPLTLIKSPPTVTLGVVTSEDLAKMKDTVGSGYVRTSLSQWVEITPAITGLSTSAGWASVPDGAGDFVGKSFWDITGVAVEEEYGWILVNVTFQNLTAITWSMDQWRLAIGIDTDHVDASGQNRMAFIGYGDARIDESINDAYWERCIVLDSITDIHVYNTAFGDLGSSGTWAELIEAKNTVRVHIPSWNLPPSPDLKLNLTVISGMDGGKTVYDAYGTYAYAYSSENTQGFYNLTKAFVTGPVMYSLPIQTETFNTAMGRPYQDITGVWAKADGTNLNVSVTLRGAPPKADSEGHVDMYLALDTADGGQDWFPDQIDARYNISDSEHYWEYCLALYSWTGATQDVDLIDMVWTITDALAQGVIVTNSTDGTTVNVTIPLTLIGVAPPSPVTIGVVTSEGGSKIKDTVGSGTAILLGGQWIQVEPAIIDLSTASTPKSATDPEKDFCGKSFWDITNVVVNLDYANIMVDVTFLNVSGLSTSWDQWWMYIGIDTDHVLGSGNPWIFGPAAGSDTRFVNESVSEWELCAIINSPTDITFYNVTGTYPNEAARWVPPPHGVTAALIEAQNKIRVVIPRSWLMLHTCPDYNLTVTVVSGVDAGYRVYDIYGSYDYGYPPEYGVIADGVFGFYVAHTHPSLNETGPYKAIISMLNGALNVTRVNVDLDHWFSGVGDPKLVVRWLTYDLKQQANQTIWTNTTLPPWRVTKLQNMTHPNDVPVEVVELVLVSDGQQIIVARFTVSRPVLIARLAVLDYLWTVPGVSRSAIMKEYVAIDGQWPYAPTK